MSEKKTGEPAMGENTHPTVDLAGFAARAKYRTTKSLVAAGSVFTVPVHVEAGDKVKYAFSTEGGDIIFGVRSVDDGGGFIKEIVPEERLKSDESHVQDVFVVERETRLVFVWDNSYSWLTEKHVVYNIDVISGPGPKGTQILRLRNMVDKLSVSRKQLEAETAECRNSQTELDRQIEALMARRAAVAAALGHAAAKLEDTLEHEDSARTALRGLLFTGMEPAVRHHIMQFLPSEDLVRWRAVSSTFLTGDVDADFWSREAMLRFGAFDHDGVFASAPAGRLGATARDLFAIRAGQYTLTGRMGEVLESGSEYTEEEYTEEEDEEEESEEEEEEEVAEEA